MGQSSSSEANSNMRENSRLLWKRKFHYRTIKSPAPIPVLSQINLAQTLQFYFPKHPVLKNPQSVLFP
jgi:hypothetical protein